MKQYCGLKCAYCKRFIVLRTYEVERPEEIGADFSLGEPVMNFQCTACGQVCGYRQSDIAFSFLPDGAEPRYIHKQAVS